MREVRPYVCTAFREETEAGVTGSKHWQRRLSIQQQKYQRLLQSVWPRGLPQIRLQSTIRELDKIKACCTHTAFRSLGVAAVEQVVTTWQNDLKLWPMANLIGFSLVPRPIRPLYASGVQLIWQCYLSSAGFAGPEGGDAEAARTLVATAVQTETA